VHRRRNRKSISGHYLDTSPALAPNIDGYSCLPRDADGVGCRIINGVSTAEGVFADRGFHLFRYATAASTQPFATRPIQS